MASKNLSRADIENQHYITKVFGWMSAALVVTGLVAMYTASNLPLANFIFGHPLLFIVMLFLEFIMVAYLVIAIEKMSVTTGRLTFLAYSALNGLTLASVFLVFTTESLAMTFYITAGTFALMSFYGFTTKKDLTSIGNLCIMSLLGIIMATFINMFLNNSIVNLVTAYIGVLVFVGLIAYDTQKIKKLNIIGNEETDEDKKEAIIGALTLYLDFINLFLMLLRIFGKRRD